MPSFSWMPKHYTTVEQIHVASWIRRIYCRDIPSIRRSLPRLPRTFRPPFLGRWAWQQRCTLRAPPKTSPWPDCCTRRRNATASCLTTQAQKRKKERCIIHQSTPVNGSWKTCPSTIRHCLARWRHSRAQQGSARSLNDPRIWRCVGP